MPEETTPTSLPSMTPGPPESPWQASVGPLPAQNMLLVIGSLMYLRAHAHWSIIGTDATLREAEALWYS